MRCKSSTVHRFVQTNCSFYMYNQSVKPENLMLSTDQTRDGVIQLVDFGCAHVEGEE
jgi:hypothetical protein